MARHPLVLRGHVVTSAGPTPGAVAVDPGTGRITAVAAHLDGDEVVDHGEHLLLPGAVDIHVHFRDPGHPEKEDFGSGTRAALHGGVTTVVDMPNTEPATTTLARYEAKRRRAARSAHCDWALWGGATAPGGEAAALARVAPGLKVYLGESTGGMTFDGALAQLLGELAAAGFRGVVAFHAEAQGDLESAGRAHAEADGLPGHAARRPAAAERHALEAIRHAVAEAGPRLPFRVHIAHASTAALAHAARALDWSVGVTPHHLFLHQDLPLGGFGRVNPPLRASADAAALWAAVREGIVPVLESDHAPHTRAEKERPVRAAPSGVPGVETLLPLLLARAAAGEVPWARVVAMAAAAPARLLGLPKGTLAVGADADILVVDPDATRRLRRDDLLTRCGWSPFEGHPVLFPREVYLRGRRVVRGGAVVATPGGGREARRRAPSEPPR